MWFFTIKKSPHIWDPCCHLVTETGSRFTQISYKVFIYLGNNQHLPVNQPNCVNGSPSVILIKLFSSTLMLRPNKLECLSMASLSSCLLLVGKPTLKRCSTRTGSGLVNNRLGWKVLLVSSDKYSTYLAILFSGWSSVHK